MAAYPTLFGAGNVVTGKGNIVASRKHATYVSQRMAEAFLGLGDPREGGHAGEEGLLAGTAAAARKTADGVAAALKPLPPPAPAMLERLLARVRERQAAVGFVGSVPDWIRAHTPPDFE
jgi:hypothetical protein